MEIHKPAHHTHVTLITVSTHKLGGLPEFFLVCFLVKMNHRRESFLPKKNPKTITCSLKYPLRVYHVPGTAVTAVKLTGTVSAGPGAFGGQTILGQCGVMTQVTQGL